MVAVATVLLPVVAPFCSRLDLLHLAMRLADPPLSRQMSKVVSPRLPFLHNPRRRRRDDLRCINANGGGRLLWLLRARVQIQRRLCSSVLLCLRWTQRYGTMEHLCRYGNKRYVARRSRLCFLTHGSGARRKRT